MPSSSMLHVISSPMKLSRSKLLPVPLLANVSGVCSVRV
jgi:hypothetical protein